jgi:hypothetical protein
MVFIIEAIDVVFPPPPEPQNMEPLNKHDFEIMVAANSRPQFGPIPIGPAGEKTPASIEPKPKINAYICDVCQAIQVSIDRDNGVTPMFIPCYNPDHGRGLIDLAALGDLSDRKRARLTPETRVAIAKANRDRKAVRMPTGEPVTARSVGYRTGGLFKAENATIEFYRPTWEQYSAMPAGPIRDHVTRGGLLFRKIGETESPIEKIAD